ncbi:hypothetical protein C8R45DRAFT_1024252 [Mycena sanguinolenta]|nr:hypothetical protein C8R45DRAFT_1024252 [Mycena sanguinolenta]
MVFHDELITYTQFLRRFEHSPFLSAYIMGYCSTEFLEAIRYISDVFRNPSMDYPVWIQPSTGELCLDLVQGGPETSYELLRSDAYILRYVFLNPPIEYNDLPVWIRPSTGKLCLDLAEGGPETSLELTWCDTVTTNVLRVENISLDAPDSEDIIISSLSEDQYYGLCSRGPIAHFQYFRVSTQHPVGPGIFRLDSQHGTCLGITEPLVFLEEELYWEHYEGAPGELLPSSWIRYDSHRTPKLDLRLSFSSYELRKAWLAQANRIFAALEEVANVESYVCVDYIQSTLRIASKHHIPKGYLFVCSPQDFRTSIDPQAHLYHWPAYPAYWSLDPSGADRLSPEDARILGFPTTHIETTMFGYLWDCSVYKGLRRFHKGKGLDPESREAARQLGYPLYEVLSDVGSEVPFPARNLSDRPWPGQCEQDDPALCRRLGHYL